MPIVRFIIITLPPPPLRDALQRFREILAAVGRTSIALTYPPHVTLRTGALVPEEDTNRFIEEFGRTVKKTQSCDILSDGIRHGTYPRNGETGYYIFYRIALTDRLSAFHRQLASYLPYKKEGSRDFAPHLTLAFDDLTPKGRDGIMKFIEEHPEQVQPDFCFPIDNVSLYIQEKGTWVPHTVYPVSGSGD